MSDLEKFDVSKQTKPTRNALAETMGDMFSFFGTGFARTLSYVFSGGSTHGEEKNQISKSLEKYERSLRKMRRKGR